MSFKVIGYAGIDKMGRKKTSSKRRQRKCQKLNKLEAIKLLTTSELKRADCLHLDAQSQLPPALDDIGTQIALEQPTLPSNDCNESGETSESTSTSRAAAKRLPHGYSKHTPGVVYYGGIREEEANLKFIQTLPMKEQVVELHRLFFDRTKAATYFRDKCVKQEEEIDELKLEYDERLKQVRCFWRDRIYNEHSRAGKLVKHSMQKK